MANGLNQNQLQFANKIRDYGLQHGFSEEQIRIAVKVAYKESSLGQNMKGAGTASGLFQYTDGAWKTSNPDGGRDRSSNDDQIATFFDDLDEYSKRYDALPDDEKAQMTREEYIYSLHHDGPFSDPTPDSDGKKVWDHANFAPLGDVIGEDDSSAGDEQSAAATGPSGGGIVSAAKASLGSLNYKLFGYNGLPSGQQKDHQFVADALDRSGLGFSGNKIPAASDWADPAVDISGWNVVDGPIQANDVLAMPKGKPDHWYFQPGQQMGIATGDGTSIGIRNNNQIAESNWGFRDDDQPTIRRYGGLAEGSDGSDDQTGTADDAADAA
jgi:hypothetical protein